MFTPVIRQKEEAVRVGLDIVPAPASSSRLALGQDGLLKYLAKGSVDNDRCDPLFEPNGQILDPLEWIAKLTLRIPEQGAQTTPYYGRYSNASRGKAAKPCAQETSKAQKKNSQSEWIKQRKASWAALIKLIYESDPCFVPGVILR